MNSAFEKAFVNAIQDQESKRKGIWTPSENEQLLEAMQLYGNKWITVAHHMKTRTPSQIRNHVFEMKKRFAIDLKHASVLNLNFEIPRVDALSNLRDFLVSFFAFRIVFI